ncbi:MAG TPA: hypothetical protein VMV41_00115 [Cellulomonadaceae bacterium]|nr:hypothetical protein [Cellulomonadaceae bacterium]
MRTPRTKQVAETAADIPPAASGHMLHGDPMTQLGEHNRHVAAVPEAHQPPVHNPVLLPPDPSIPVDIRHASNDQWVPLMLAIPLGKAVEILGRDEQRETVDVTNQTLAITGQTALLFLFADEQRATDFANDSTTVQAARLNQGIRMTILPDGSGRTFTHTASVWAVAYGAAGGIAILDVSTERKARYRR